VRANKRFTASYPRCLIKSSEEVYPAMAVRSAIMSHVNHLPFLHVAADRPMSMQQAYAW